MHRAASAVFVPSRTAVAGGIALINTFGTGAGGFIGPTLIGFMREDSGGFSSSMGVLAIGLIATCAIALAFGRYIAPRTIRSGSRSPG